MINPQHNVKERISLHYKYDGVQDDEDDDDTQKANWLVGVAWSYPL